MVSEELSSPSRAGQNLQWKETYCQLIDSIIKHFRYPDDLDSMTAEERDDFRDFRHVMGDVLKDAVLVIGQQEALLRPFSVLSQITTDGAFIPDAHWQDIEAPLFSIRSMVMLYCLQ